MAAGKSEKTATLAGVYAYLKAKKDDSLTFSNALIKEHTGTKLSNQFDVTKIDTSARIPEDLRKEDLFIVHLGGGKHRFVKGIKFGYHGLEPIPSNRTYRWEYVPSMLDGSDKSEAGVLSLAFNQQIIQHFLFGDRVVPLRIHVPRRTRDKELNSFSYHVGATKVSVRNLQIEMDFIVEKNGLLAIAEAKYSPKTGFVPADFAVAQVYLPYRRLLNLKAKKKWNTSARCMFVVQYRPSADAEALRLYEYDFDDPDDMASIRLVKCAEYLLQVSSPE